MYFLPIFFSFLLTTALCVSVTYKDHYLPGHVEKTLFNVDWSGCLQACHDEPGCISSNYCKEKTSCEINSDGIKEECERKPTIFSRGWIFHQIRPAPEPQIVPEFGEDPSTAAKSCQDIFNKRSNVSNGAYYIEALGKVRSIYCKMETTVDCGEGGWTLAMKIDGNKTTFSYDSQLWKNEKPYKEDQGGDLSNTETKLSLFGSLVLHEGFCVGMKVNGDTKWLKINSNSASAASVFHGPENEYLNIERSQWTSLINGSSIHSGSCSRVKEGFNIVDDSARVNGARARIGLIGHKPCNQPAKSRIGFGTDGSTGGMDPNNTCGNEAFGVNGDEISIKAFCYIFIK